MNIQRVAVIGAGPSGLASLNELLHTSKEGKSTIRSFCAAENNLPADPAFEVVVFEQGNDIGGTWNYSASADPCLPGDSKPDNVRTLLPVPDAVESASFDNPLPSNVNLSEVCLWNKSGLYDELFTNVPDRMMRFSAGLDLDPQSKHGSDNPYHPFVTRQHVSQYLQNFAEVNDLKKHVRFNSTVEKLYKKDDKWVLNVLVTEEEGNKWYSETFDAVMLCNGRFKIPFVPKIEGLDEFARRRPNDVSHTKAFRNVEPYRGKKVLLVGSSISAIDLLQYLIPACKEVWLSSNSVTALKVSNEKHTGKPKDGQWISDILHDENLKYNRCSRIKRFEGDTVIFEDGSAEKFDKILFATGYHLSYPFLNIPENEGKNYINILSGKKGDDNHAMTKADGVYMYTFSVADPTLAFIGIAHTPLIFLMSELGAMAAAGVWSNIKHLPSVKEQKLWCEEKLASSKDGLTMISEKDFKAFVDTMFPLAPLGRINFKDLIIEDEVELSRLVLKELFYKYVNGEIV